MDSEYVSDSGHRVTPRAVFVNHSSLYDASSAVHVAVLYLPVPVLKPTTPGMGEGAM